MLIFPMKKEWYEKIKSGEKTIEYREVKPYWTKRIVNDFKREVANSYPKLREQIKKLTWKDFLEIAEIDPVVFESADTAQLQDLFLESTDPFTLQGLFRLGYGREKLSATITKIELVDGKDTDLHIDKPVYAIHFYLQNNM